jgi:uncharacterized protein with PIN domain
MASPAQSDCEIEPLPDSPCPTCQQPMQLVASHADLIPALCRAWYLCAPCGQFGWVDWMNVDDTADGA